jgi:uncharacterized phage-associated protein
MAPEFDADRFRELVLYVAWRTRDDPHFGRVKMAKTLFYTDFHAYAAEGQAVTAAKYEHWQYGPFPPVLYEVEKELVKSGLANELRSGDGDEAKLIVTREPATPHIEAWHREFVDIKIKELAPLTAVQVSADSHDHPGWDLTADREEIPYAAALIPTKPSAQVMAIARRVEQAS